MNDTVEPSPAPLDRWWQRLARARGGDTRFLIGVTFFVSFVWIRITTGYLQPAPTVGAPGFVQVGGRSVFFGYHPHHIAWGIFWLAVAGWITIHYQRPLLVRASAIMYGLGLGLIVDEASLVVRGINPESDLAEVVVLVLLIGTLVMSTVYAPSFWRSVHVGLWQSWLRLRGRVRRNRDPPTPPEGGAPPTP